MTNLSPIKRSETLKDLAYHKVKDLLRSGQMEVDTLYSANRFADSLGVSRTPVREALLQLASEGFLVSLEGRGFQIRRFSRKEIQDLIEARRLIETYVVERLAEKGGEFDTAGEALSKMVERQTKADSDGFLEADETFHLELVRELDNGFLQSVMANIRDCISLLGHQALAVQGRMKEVVAEHRGILEALRKKDSPRAIEAMRRHLNSTEKYLLSDHQESSVPHARDQHPT